MPMKHLIEVQGSVLSSYLISSLFQATIELNSFNLCSLLLAITPWAFLSSSYFDQIWGKCNKIVKLFPKQELLNKDGNSDNLTGQPPRR